MTEMDDKVQCPNCNRKIIPRLSYENGRPVKSWCPLCGGLVENFYLACDVVVSVVCIICVITFYFAF